MELYKPRRFQIKYLTIVFAIMSIAFAKEYWILKDWKSLSGGFRGRSPYLNIVDTSELPQDYEKQLPKVQGGHGGPPPWEFWLLLFLQK